MAGRNIIEPSDTQTFEYIKRIVSENYKIGELVSAERNGRGYINTSYDIETLRDGKKNQYLLRRYRGGTHENKIRFEHALMHELLARKFHLSPSLILTNDGATYARLEEHLVEGKQDFFIAIFSYLPGEDRYSWDDPLCTKDELRSAAEVFALYHNAIFDWEGAGYWGEPRFIDLVPLMERRWKTYAKRGGDTVFGLYFQEKCGYLSTIMKNPLYLPARGVYDKLPHLAIHGDYHPANLKYQVWKIVGLFDFDWAKMDTRCFDVGLAITYFCTSWEDTRDGDLILDRVDLFSDSYQEAAKKASALGPLSSLELKCLPQMIIAGNLFVLDWTIREFYTTRPDPEEYLRYLRHSVKSLRWIEVNWNLLTDLTPERHRGV